MEKNESIDTNKYLNYQNMFYLFMIANIGGAILEGIWTVYKFGRWETHTVAIWGPFCLLYGIGGVVFCIGNAIIHKKNIGIQFLFYAFIANTVEYLCAWLIEDGLGMRAWTYKKHFINLQGRICLDMTIIWGVIGVVFAKYLVPRINRLFKKMQGQFWRVACIVLTIFMIINLSMTALCLVRWSKRHKGIESTSQFEDILDHAYDDSKMKKIFCEWWFIDEQKEFWEDYKKK